EGMGNVVVPEQKRGRSETTDGHFRAKQSRDMADDRDRRGFAFSRRLREIRAAASASAGSRGGSGRAKGCSDLKGMGRHLGGVRQRADQAAGDGLSTPPDL